MIVVDKDTAMVLGKKVKLGRPPLNPRIAELEKQVNALLNVLGGLQHRIKILEEQVSRGTLRPGEMYIPRFESWPGNGR